MADGGSAPPPGRAAVSPAMAVLTGLVGLAAAMGIGRFAFTPLLPMMQAEQGLTIAQGAALAAANYLGYLMGALASFAFTPTPRRAARAGLVLVALTTLAMGAAQGLVAWALLRWAAGVASAWVLVGASGWALAQLGAARRADLSGAVFAGVGCGIVVAGLACLALAALGQGAGVAWFALGALAGLVAVLTWPLWAHPLPAAAAMVSTGSIGSTPAAPRLGGAAIVLVIAYGLLGLGYIVPATFLPAAARALAADPAVFGWAWPIFGLAAAVSTVAVGRLWPRAAPRRVAALAQAVMALGVMAPALRLNLFTIVISALCVGGTFMVVTMAGLQEARRLASGSPTRLMSAMTAAFALGQLVGPLLVGAQATPTEALVGPSYLAAALLAAAALALWFTSPRTES